MALQFRDYLSILDTERFGFLVAKFDQIPENLPDFIHELKINDVELCIARITLTEMRCLHLLEEYGFRIMDIQTTYRYLIGESLPSLVFNNVWNIRKAEPSDNEELVRLAKMSFSDYGHYAADARLPVDKVGEIYGDWARRSLEDKNVADIIFIAEDKSNVIGFLTFKIWEDKGIKYAAGGLGCVDSHYRGKNVFPLLVLEGLRWGQSKGLAWEEHNVLINNYSVNNSIAKIGFKIYKSFATLHLWLRH